MLESDLRFATAFLQAHPDAAADVLELQTPDVNASLLSHLPLDLACSTLATMLPLHAARVLKQLEHKPAARILAELKANQIAGILRYVDLQTGDSWLKHLPFDQSTACRLLLNYSTTMVGGWMVPQVMMLATECTAGEALQRIPQEDSRIDTDAIYIVNRELIPQGVISVFNLLKAKSETPLGRMMDRKTFAISGRASLISVKGHDGWNHRDTLPVLNRRHQLIGMLRHVDLRKGLERDVSHGDVANSAIPVTDIYKTYSNVLVALFNVLNDVTGKK